MHCLREVNCCNCGSTIDKHEILVNTKFHSIKNLSKVPLTLVGCKICGLVFQNPQVTIEVLSDFYSNSYDFEDNFKNKEDEITYLESFAHKKTLITYPWLLSVFPNILNRTILDMELYSSF